MLERVPLLEKHLDDYAGVVGVDVIERIRALGRAAAGRAGPPRQRHRLRRRRRRAARHPRAAAAQRRHRRRLAGDARQRRVLRRHQGGAQRAAGRRHRVDARRCSASTSRRCSTTRCCSRATTTSSSIHDPQPAAMLSFLRERLGGQMSDTKWIWRCHIDLTDANPTVWEFFRPFVELHDASVWTMPEFVPASLDDGPRRARAAVHRPALGEEPRAGDAVLPGDHQAVRRRRRTARSCARSAASTRGRTRSA